ncbi:MAG: signal peptide peptidase SppA, partial [Bacteroidia bacterium]|nr:signal peptide peptidase SppA [Bacteroidia bacterium]
MKQFFKFLFASCLGTILALGVLFFGFFMIGSVFSAKDTSIPKNSVLLVEFNNFVPEKTGNVEQNPYSFELQSSLGLQRIKDLIHHASDNDNIKGIVYKTSSNTPLGMVTSTEIKKAIEEFRDSTDKFVYTYADFFTHKSYLLASASDSIFMNPNGMLEMKGYGAMIPFFKEMMDKAGIEMNIFYAGNYKSATEPFRRNDISPANREQTREYLNENFELYLNEVAGSRGISKDNLLNLVNNLDLENLPEALENELVDGTTYWFEFEDKLRDRLGLSDGKKIRYMDLDEYNSKVTIKRGSSKNRIAVVYAEGEVVYDSEEKAVISERKYNKIFDKIKRDKKVKAVVLRVNSPGGSAFASDAIWGEIEEIKARGIPVIASFGDYAASGGYYIAAGADKIVSHPQTLTGSIGVFTLFPNFTDLMEDKLGIHFDTVKTSPHAVSFTPFYDLTEEEKNELTTFVDQLYSKFLSR